RQNNVTANMNRTNRKMINDLKKKAFSLEQEYLFLSLEIDSLKRENSILRSLQQALSSPTGTSSVLD
ncbi:12714_t:CDS:1, partial [Racocetra fulgida]